MRDVAREGFMVGDRVTARGVVGTIVSFPAGEVAMVRIKLDNRPVAAGRTMPGGYINVELAEVRRE